jgi:hypothetical protein
VNYVKCLASLHTHWVYSEYRVYSDFAFKSFCYTGIQISYLYNRIVYIWSTSCYFLIFVAFIYDKNYQYENMYLLLNQLNEGVERKKKKLIWQRYESHSSLFNSDNSDWEDWGVISGEWWSLKYARILTDVTLANDISDRKYILRKGRKTNGRK